MPLREPAAGARGGRERCGMAIGPDEARLRLRLLGAADWTTDEWTGHPVIRNAGAAAAGAA